MDAVIMAAGLGTRLRPHTLTTPKPLLPVQGRPILDWSLGALPPAGDRVLVVVNYLAEQIEAYLRTQKHFARWAVVRQEKPLGTGDALRSCRPHVRSDHLLVLNGDDLYGAADLAKTAELASRPDVRGGMLCHYVDEPRSYGIAFVGADGVTLERLEEKPDIDGRRLANTGVYLFPRGVFDVELKLSERGEYEITQYVSALIPQGVRVVPAQFWLPIGTLEAWQAAQTRGLATVLKGR